MPALESRFGSWVIAARWPIIAASVVLAGIAASGTLLLEFSADYRIYASRDNPQRLASEAMENTYGKTDNVFFTIVPEDGDATSALSLEATAWLTERSWRLPYATRVDSLTNFQHTTARGDDIRVRDLVDDDVIGDAGERSGVRAVALAEPRLAGRFIARDGRVGGIDVTVHLPGEDEMLEGARVSSFARELADEVRKRFPGIDVRVTGG